MNNPLADFYSGNADFIRIHIADGTGKAAIPAAYLPPSWVVCYQRGGDEILEATPHLSRKDAEARASWLIANGIADAGTVRVMKRR